MIPPFEIIEEAMHRVQPTYESGYCQFVRSNSSHTGNVKIKGCNNKRKFTRNEPGHEKIGFCTRHKNMIWGKDCKEVTKDEPCER